MLQFRFLPNLPHYITKLHLKNYSFFYNQQQRQPKKKSGCKVIIILYKKFLVGNKVNHVNTQYDEIGVTISKTQALAYAQRLYTAMEGVGTKEDVIDAVYNTLKNNPNNVKAVYNAFGTRDYGLFGSPQWWVSNSSGDLKDWLKWELSGQKLERWNTLLSSANII